ncbi:hypothetical protein [Kitasatospora sp. NPDC057500]|uniref:hypothetical protein n=1 Tax=Kitasatospora sp. NPDC057500 TaxID=3346151 RepID=UPI003681229A
MSRTRARRSGARNTFALLLAGACLTAVSAPTAAGAVEATGRTGGPPARAQAVTSAQVPPGVTAGVAVYDRQTGTFTEQLNATAQFRSASVVKLLIALDYLWNRGPGYDIPSADRVRLDAMLRSSDDGAASHYWANNGSGAIVDRMVARLALTNTARPADDGMWGYTAVTAADTVRIYRYLLEQAPAAVRDYVLGNLHASTRCGTDGFDQHFGIAGSFEQPWAVKQGWAGFSSGGCSPQPPHPPTAAAAATPDGEGAAGAGGTLAVDLTRPVLHSTGTVGTGDRSIVAVYTSHPVGTAYGKAYTDLGRLTRSLNVPGAVQPAGSWFGTWGENVRVRPQPGTGQPEKTLLPGGVEVLVKCQEQGETVSIPPYVNDWWAYLPQYGGYVTNIYLQSPGNQLPGVPTC